MPCIGIDPVGHAEGLLIDGAVQKNGTGEPTAFLHVRGSVTGLRLRGVDTGDDPVIGGEGKIVFAEG